MLKSKLKKSLIIILTLMLVIINCGTTNAARDSMDDNGGSGGESSASNSSDDYYDIDHLVEGDSDLIDKFYDDMNNADEGTLTEEYVGSKFDKLLEDLKKNRSAHGEDPNAWTPQNLENMIRDDSNSGFGVTSDDFLSMLEDHLNDDLRSSNNYPKSR